ncbi:MAG: polysaccharide deacetylase family protein [Balneolaceae bacterium]
MKYHRLTKQKVSGSARFLVNLDDFIKQMKLLETLNYTTVTFQDVHLYQEGRLSLPKKPIIITFDGGHRTTYELAIPVMMQLKMQGVIFVLGDRSMRYAVWKEEKRRERLPLMTDWQILEARKNGFEIGAHSMNHPDLSDFGLRKIREEIVRSRQTLEYLLGEPVHSFAYPHGLLDTRIESIVAEAGFRFACGDYGGSSGIRENPFNIHRASVYNNSRTLRFYIRLTAPYKFFEWGYYSLKKKSSMNSISVGHDYVPTISYEKNFR